MYRSSAFFLVSALIGGGALAPAAEKTVAAPKVVKFTQLIAAIKAQKDKVVVVDFWADT